MTSLIEPMTRLVRVLSLIVVLTPAALRAQDGAPRNSSPAENAVSSDDVKTLREMLDQQSRQLDVLAQEIARLNLLLEGKAAPAVGAAPTPAPSATETQASAAPAPAPDAHAPKAEAVQPSTTPSGPVHIIAKGETLTVIAKHYKVTVPDLLKVNKIADVRRLQIGQTLALPPDATIPPATPAPSPTPE
jgi:LysM repeat protein